MMQVFQETFISPVKDSERFTVELSKIFFWEEDKE